MPTMNVAAILSPSQQMSLIEANVPDAVFQAVQDATKNLSPLASFDDVAAAKVLEYAKHGYSVDVIVSTPA